MRSLFGQLKKKMGNLFIPLSGHTAPGPRLSKRNCNLGTMGQHMGVFCYLGRIFANN